MPVLRARGGHGPRARDRRHRGSQNCHTYRRPVEAYLPVLDARSFDGETPIWTRVEGAVVRVCGVDSTLLDRMDLERHPGGIGDQADVGWVRRDDGVQSAGGPLDHGRVDDVIVARTGRQRAGRPGLFSGQILDVAAFQESRQGRLGAASPSLGQNSRRDHRRQAPAERGPVK